VAKTATERSRFSTSRTTSTRPAIADTPTGSACAGTVEQMRTYSAAWQTASTLLPSGSRTNAP
jgi:hypothetical protein